MPLPQCQNTFLAAPATQKLFLPLLPGQNTFLALSGSPKALTGHNWSQTGNTRRNLVTTWQHLVTTWQHLATKNGQRPDQNCSLYIATPPTQFKFPTLFLARTRQIGPVPEIYVPDTFPKHHQKFRGPRAKQLKLVRIATDRQTTDRLRRDTEPLSPPNPPFMQAPLRQNPSAAKILALPNDDFRYLSPIASLGD